MKRLNPIFLMCFVVIFSMAAFQRNAVWMNGMGLWKDARDKSFSKARVHVNFGIACNRIGLYDEAAAEFKTAIGINPFIAAARNSLGNSFYEKGMLDEAVSEYRLALNINPDFAQAHNNLGMAYERMGKTGEALSEYSEAIRIMPDFSDAHLNLGVIYLAYLKDGKKAAVHFAKALELNPDSPRAKRIRELFK